MDVDFSSCSPETQVKLMNLMLQLQQLGELSEPLPPNDQLSTAPVLQAFHAPIRAGPQTSLSLGANTAHDPIMAPVLSNAELSMREMVFRMAAMQPIHIDPESVRPPKRRNMRISKDPQRVAARLRRERISERMRILQRMVPGGTKMDTASMLDEAINYVKFLKTQVRSLERAAVSQAMGEAGLIPGFSMPSHGNYYSCLQNMYQLQ